MLFSVNLLAISARNTSDLAITEESGAENGDVEVVNWTLFGAFPTHGNLFYRQQLVRPVLDYAIEEINNASIAPERLDLTFIGTETLTSCELLDTLVVYKVIEEVTSAYVSSVYTKERLIQMGYLGPGCAKSVEDIAKWQNGQYKGHS